MFPDTTMLLKTSPADPEGHQLTPETGRRRGDAGQRAGSPLPVSVAAWGLGEHLLFSLTECAANNE